MIDVQGSVWAQNAFTDQWELIYTAEEVAVERMRIQAELDRQDVAIGYNAGFSLSSGNYNIAIGHRPLDWDEDRGTAAPKGPSDCPNPEYVNKSRWWCRRCKLLDTCKPRKGK